MEVAERDSFDLLPYERGSTLTIRVSETKGLHGNVPFVFVFVRKINVKEEIFKGIDKARWQGSGR